MRHELVLTARDAGDRAGAREGVAAALEIVDVGGADLYPPAIRADLEAIEPSGDGEHTRSHDG